MPTLAAHPARGFRKPVVIETGARWLRWETLLALLDDAAAPWTLMGMRLVQPRLAFLFPDGFCTPGFLTRGPSGLVARVQGWLTLASETGERDPAPVAARAGVDAHALSGWCAMLGDIRAGIEAERLATRRIEGAGHAAA